MTNKRIDEAAYSGNIGVMELMKFYSTAKKEHIDKVKKLIANKQHKEAWKHIQAHTGVKLVGKEFNEGVDPDILPPSGAGNDGTETLVNKYKSDTPGQKIAKFKDWSKHK